MDCGAPLDPKLEKLSSHIDDRIAATLGEKLRDQKLVEYEVRDAVVARLAWWGRGLVILVGGIVTGLGFFGFSEISGTSKSIKDTGDFIKEEVKAIENAKVAVMQLIDDIKTKSNTLDDLLKENKQTTKQLDETIKSLKSNLVNLEHLKYFAYTEVVSGTRIINWIWPNGINGLVNTANVNALRDWINRDKSLIKGLPIQKFLDSEQAKEFREQAIKDLNIP